jgi:hypothetical protein
MSDKPVGGRGHKAPYTTKTIRIPVAIEPQVEKLTDIYRQAVSQGSWDDVEGKELLGSTTPIDRLTRDEAIEEAYKILRGRKSAKISLEKLLQVLYRDKNIKL